MRQRKTLKKGIVRSLIVKLCTFILAVLYLINNPNGNLTAFEILFYNLIDR